MPTVSLRLSDSELAQLREWAFGSRRSLQREVVFRLFDGAMTGAVPAEVATASPLKQSVGRAGSTAVNQDDRIRAADVVQPRVHDVPVESSAPHRSWKTSAELGSEARGLALRDGKCGADVARGTKCKLCGKVH